MRIKSTFKDYYDHQAHVYGGGDPLVTYARNPSKPESVSGSDAIAVLALGHDSITLLCPFARKLADTLNPRWILSGDYRLKDEVRWLAIAGQLFLLVGSTTQAAGKTTFSVLSEKNQHHIQAIHRLSKRACFFRERLL